MSEKLNRWAYEKLIAKNLEWLSRQPRTLEREHIILIVKASADHEYGPSAELQLELKHAGCREGRFRMKQEVEDLQIALNQALDWIRDGRFNGKYDQDPLSIEPLRKLASLK